MCEITHPTTLVSRLPHSVTSPAKYAMYVHGAVVPRAPLPARQPGPRSKRTKKKNIRDVNARKAEPALRFSDQTDKGPRLRAESKDHGVARQRTSHWVGRPTHTTKKKIRLFFYTPPKKKETQQAHPTQTASYGCLTLVIRGTEPKRAHQGGPTRPPTRCMPRQLCVQRPW